MSMKDAALPQVTSEEMAYGWNLANAVMTGRSPGVQFDKIVVTRVWPDGSSEEVPYVDTAHRRSLIAIYSEFDSDKANSISCRINAIWGLVHDPRLAALVTFERDNVQVARLHDAIFHIACSAALVEDCRFAVDEFCRLALAKAAELNAARTVH